MRRLACIGLAATALAAAATATAAAKPTLVVRPAASPPGRLVTVTGRGFCGAPACSAVRIFVFGQPAASGVRVSAGGAFTRRVRVPGVTSPEENGVVATQRLANGAESGAFAPLQVVLRIAPPRPATSPATTASEPPPATSPPATSAPPTATTAAPPATTAPATEPPPTSTTATTGTSEVPPTPADTETGSPTESQTTAAAATGDEDDGGDWAWLAVLAAAGVLAAAAGWAVSRARRAR